MRSLSLIALLVGLSLFAGPTACPAPTAHVRAAHAEPDLCGVGPRASAAAEDSDGDGLADVCDACPLDGTNGCTTAGAPS